MMIIEMWVQLRFISRCTTTFVILDHTEFNFIYITEFAFRKTYSVTAARTILF